MSLISHALRARKFYPFASRHQAASQAVKYAKAINYLGDRWIVVKHSQRLEQERPV